MLLERLPYMSLLKKCNRFPDLRDLAQDLDKITKMSGSAILDADEEHEVEAASEGVEQWSTDKPVEEVARKRRPFGLKKGSNPTTAVVKEKIESLVIVDDDIED